jgi:hypothetical protein
MIKVEMVPCSAFGVESEISVLLSISASENDIATSLRKIVNWANGQNAAI